MTSPGSGPRSWGVRMDLVFHSAFAVIGIYTVYESQRQMVRLNTLDLESSPYFFPILMGIAISLVGLWGLATSLKSKRYLLKSPGFRFWAMFWATIVYTAAFQVVGFLISTAVFAGFSAWALGEKKWYWGLVFAVGMSWVFWQLFAVNFGLSLPEGLMARLGG